MRRRWYDGQGTLVIPGVGAGTGTGTGAELRIPLEIATSYRARTKGLLGRDTIEGALLLSPAGSIHTIGMRIPIDVAYLDRHLKVLAVRTMHPGRLGLPRLRARHVLEAGAGAMAGWGLSAGVVVRIVAARGQGGSGGADG
ncbi:MULTISPECIES: DUF192 domain-containing protein [unclassified Streptomyces]|uniref:DUF192 domain-containing protein n=1 Tax=unclassified Streptomyces TaxID=2593676 RepID=UPI0009401139|nr:DUF192 domain-containing protein [Streptomyces sp. TSRI0107]OKJ87660.1 hypothetical protein AMK31_10890 [Streptomyces sp. TSRI0107]